MQADATPDPNFVERLEWQLRRELRRTERFAPARGQPSKHWATIAVMLLGAGLVGAAGMGAAQQAQVARRAEPVVKLMETRVKAAAQVHASAAAALADANALHQAGQSPASGVTRADARLSLAEARAARATLDLEEVRLSGLPPRDELSAPKVKGHDFVAGRLRATLASQTRQLALAQTTRDQARTMYQNGLGTNAAVASAQLAADLAEIDVRETTARLGARERFLAGNDAAEAAERADLRTLGDHRVLRAEARAKVARARLETTRQLNAAGGVGADELHEVEDALAEAQWELAIAQSEVELLGGVEEAPR